MNGERLVGRAPGDDDGGGLRRLEVAGELAVRAEAGGDGRIIEGLVVPFGQVATVRDEPGGRAYRETITSVRDGLDPASVLLEAMLEPATGQLHRGAVLVGRGIEGEATAEGYRMAFRVSRTRNGDDALELARDRILGRMSVVFAPDGSPSRRRGDGVVERSQIDLRRVAVLERGAYDGAVVTAVRAGAEDSNVKKCETCGAEIAEGATHTCESSTSTTATPPASSSPPAAAPAQAAGQDRGDPTTLAGRSAAERADIEALARALGVTPAAGRAPAYVTREAPIYGPGSGRSFFRDAFYAQRGESEAAGRIERHYAMVEDLNRQVARATSIDQHVVGRAGEVLSSEIAGAYPSQYMPGLLVNRILKERPMGGFYQRVPIDNGLPRIHPVATTSTTVAAQGAEGANPAASDFATTATTVTPVFYGGETLVSRQVIDGADPSIDQMLQTDLTEAYMQASEAVIKTAVEAGSTASGVTLTAATPFVGLVNLILNHVQNVFLPAGRLFLPTTLFGSAILQNDTAGRPLLPFLNPMNAGGQINENGVPGIGGTLLGTPIAQSWASTAGAGAGVGGVAVVGRSSDFVIYESNVVRFRFTEGAGAPASIRIGLWAYLVVGTRRGSRKATGA